MSTASLPELLGAGAQQIADFTVPAQNLSGSMTTFQLEEKVVLLMLTLRAPGNERTVRDKSIIKTDANLDRLHVGKRLLECEEYRAISILDGQIRDYVARIALPTPFKAGTHVIALGLLNSVDTKLCALQQQRTEAIERFIDVYDLAKADAKNKLGELFRDEEYLDEDSLRAAYRMTWQYVTLTAPDRMRALNKEIFEREKLRLQEQWNAAIDDMRDALRVGLSELVSDMVKRLDGDSKAFKPTKLLERFTEFLETFDARNVTGDEELRALADQARSILAGVDTEQLKKSKELRQQVRDGMAMAQNTLGQLEVKARGARRISFEDE